MKGRVRSGGLRWRHLGVNTRMKKGAWRELKITQILTVETNEAHFIKETSEQNGEQM